MIKDNQRFFNRLHVVADAVSIAAMHGDWVVVPKWLPAAGRRSESSKDHPVRVVHVRKRRTGSERRSKRTAVRILRRAGSGSVLSERGRTVIIFLRITNTEREHKIADAVSRKGTER